ncbi:MAG TPA: hypothetical protein VGG14_15210 [Candidatus Sulfotelmatobacter sp.]|jgi:hypothetical protein
MKNLELTFILFIVLAASAAGQDIQHAPSVEQCRADNRLWRSLDDRSNGFNEFTTRQLMGMAGEMQRCAAVDPRFGDPDGGGDTYWNMSMELHSAVFGRYMHFVNRHGLGPQFDEEDAKGAR